MMKQINRRRFLFQTTKSLGVALALSYFPQQMFAHANAAKMPVGFQTFPIRDILAKDFAGTLKMMAGQGYKLVEMGSPQGYANIGFGPLVNMKTADMRSIITDAGLSCPSCHFGSAELFDKLDASIEFSQQLGLTQMICSTFWLPRTARLNDYYIAADKLNKAAEKIKKAGMQGGFHNRDFEFVKLEGQLIYDALLSRFDPNLVKMQFQTQVITLGHTASTYFNRYPGRIYFSPRIRLDCP